MRPTCREFQFENIETLATGFSPNFDSVVQQLSAGHLGRGASVALPGMALYRVCHHATIRFQEWPTMEGLAFWAALDAKRPLRWRSLSLERPELMLQQGREYYDYILPAGCSGFLIEIDSDLRRELGWNQPVSLPLGIREQQVRRLGRTVLEAIALCQSPGPSALGAAFAGLIRDRVLVVLRETLEGDRAHRVAASPLDRSYAVVRAAEFLVAQLPPEAPVVIPELAAALELSERTLQRAFLSWAGVGPRRYFAIRRLHAFRRRLFDVRPGRGAVSEAAARSGFHNRGRLARDYRELFGESPGQTVRGR